ncbi:MAG TPA: BatA domain-containing protein [Verrucomicrobiales bacterium]|nr:BatA domain-containing protein [Verrucomicrobiales bacterium]
MDVSFGNSLGFLGLLGIPAVLAIHFFQRRSRQVATATLFLLEQMQRESVSGRRFERLRSSTPLWLQLAIVGLITWSLVQPRWLQKDAVHKVAVVLDASSSMAVFRDQAREALQTRLGRMEEHAATLEYVLMDTNLQTPSLYHGTSLDELDAAAAKWEPQLGAHDVSPALRVARGLVGREGLVVYATDHVVDNLPYEGRLLAVGRPVQNTGFAGLSVEERGGSLFWRTLVRNYGVAACDAQWWIEAGGGQGEPRSIHLEPGEALALEGAFSGETGSLTLVLSGDPFPLDDRLPIVRPVLKRLRVGHSGGEVFRVLFDQVLGSFENVEEAEPGEDADLRLVRFDPLDPELPEGNAFVFVDDPLAGNAYLEGRIVAEDDPLVAGLNWQAFLCRQSLQVSRKAGDSVLLWIGERPMILLRGVPGRETLIFNFDIARSNGARLSAFVVLVHRFLERVRDAKVGLETANFETGQEIRLAFRRDPDAPPIEFRADSAAGTERRTYEAERLRFLGAPLRPGFFEVTQGSEALLRGAAHFGDTREADLTKAAFEDRLGDPASEVVRLHSREDAAWRVWILVALASALLSWCFTRGRSRNRHREESEASATAPPEEGAAPGMRSSEPSIAL